MPRHPRVRTVAKVPEQDEATGALELPGAIERLEAIDHQHDRRDARVAIIITAVAFAVMVVASLLLVVSAARS